MPIRTQNPLYQQLLAMPLERPQTLTHGQFAANVATTFSNIFEYAPFNNEFVDFDLEQWRTALQFQFGVSRNIDVSLEVPLISQFGGFLDNFVEGYHTAFGFANAGRDKKPHGAFAFKLGKNGNTLFDYDQQKLGFADASVRAKYQLFNEANNAPLSLAGALFLKLPTGETDAGLGSGHADIGAAVFLEKTLNRWRFNSEVGATILGGHARIDAFTRWGFVQFGQSVSYAPWRQLAFVAQLSGNTPAFKNFATDLLADPALEFTLGLNGVTALGQKGAQNFVYSFGFSEDILSRGPSVDFSLFGQVGVRY